MACCDVSAVQASMLLIAKSGVPHHFRTTRVDPLLSEREYGHIRTQIPLGSQHKWQPFRSAYSHDPSLREPAPRVAAVRHYAETHLGTEAVAGATELCTKVAKEFPNSVFFAGKLVFRQETWFQRLLHNETALAIQKRLHFDGLDNLEVTFDGFRPTAVTMVVHRVTATNLAMTFGR